MPNTVVVGTGPRFPTPAAMYLVEGDILEQAQRAFTDFVLIPEDQLPPATLQPAWVLEGGALYVDLATAHELVRKRLQQERAPLLAELDVTFVRALERGEDTSGIVREKQTLRDITEVDLTGYSLEALATLNLTELLEKSHGS